MARSLERQNIKFCFSNSPPRGRKVETWNVSSFRASGSPKLGTNNVSRIGLPGNLTNESRDAGRLEHGMFQAFELPEFRNLEHLMFQGSGFLSTIVRPLQPAIVQHEAIGQLAVLRRMREIIRLRDRRNRNGDLSAGPSSGQIINFGDLSAGPSSGQIIKISNSTSGSSFSRRCNSSSGSSGSKRNNSTSGRRFRSEVI